jgi:phytoene synthase
MSFEVARARSLYESASAGLALLPPASARCVGAAHRLYSGILDEIEANRGDVFTKRASVPTWKKVAAAARIVLPARA